MALEISQVIQGKYQIVRLLGEGGMGAVYEGLNLRIRRRVAIKTLHSTFSENKEVVARFEREAQAAGQIGNDHIMEVLDLGQLDNGDLFLVMEFLDGEALSKRLERLGAMTPEQLVPLFHDVLLGLGAAHKAGIIHRDLKPDNIFILKEKAGKTDFVKIIDFGISKFQPLSGEGMRMTKTGAMMGTPYYMSPEQATVSHEVGPASDVYALGVILYECVTGAVPFDAPTFNQLLFKIALTPARDVLEVVPNLDPAFASIIMKAMAREVGSRFQSCEEFSAALQAWSRNRASVSIPPPASEAALRAAAVRASLGGAAAPPPVSVDGAAAQGPGGRSTAGSWSSSQFNAGGRPSSSSIVVGLAAAGVLLLGGGAFIAYAVLGDDGDAVTSPAAASVEAQVASATAAPAAAPEPKAAEPAKVPEPTPKPVSVAAEPAPEAEKAKVVNAPGPEKAASQAPRRTAPAPAPTAAKPPAEKSGGAPPPATGAAKPQSGDIDYGY